MQQVKRFLCRDIKQEASWMTKYNHPRILNANTVPTDNCFHAHNTFLSLFRSSSCIAFLLLDRFPLYNEYYTEIKARGRLGAMCLVRIPENKSCAASVRGTFAHIDHLIVREIPGHPGYSRPSRSVELPSENRSINQSSTVSQALFVNCFTRIV